MKLTNAPEEREGREPRSSSTDSLRPAMGAFAEPAVELMAPVVPSVARMAAEFYLDKRRTEVAMREAESRNETLEKLQGAEVREPRARSHGRTAAPETPSQPQAEIQQLLGEEVCQTCRMALQSAVGKPPEQQRDVLEAYETYKAAEQDYEAGRLSRAEMEQATDRLLDAAGL